MDSGKYTTLASGILALIIALILIVGSLKSFLRHLKSSPDQPKRWVRASLSIIVSIICLLIGLNFLSQVISLLK